MHQSCAIDQYKSFDFAPTPAMLVDTHGTLLRVNAALRAVFGDEAAGCRGKHFSEFAARILVGDSDNFLPPSNMTMQHAAAARSLKGIAFKSSNLQIEPYEVSVTCSRFGKLQLNVTEIPQLSPDDGLWTGSTIWLNIADGFSAAECRKAIHAALSHELLWDLYASGYDQILPAMFFYREALDRHCAALSDARLHKIVDIGAGTGLQMQRLLAMGKDVTAVEISRAMLARLQSRIAAADSQAFSIFEESAESLPQLKSSSFDAATILLAFFDMHDPWKALREAQRILKPGGKLVFTEPRASFDVNALMRAGKDSLIASGEFSALESAWNRIETVAPLIRDRISNSQESELTGPINRLWNAEAAYEVLEQEGYRNLTIVDSHLGNCATVQGLKP